MTMRVYELARELGVPSRELLEMFPGLGIEATSHASNLSDAEAATVKSAVAGGTEGHVLRFDKRTGKGEIILSTPHDESEYPFDLKWTRLENTKYAPISPGKKVRVKVAGRRVNSIAVES